jgi:hypothetical protein
MSNALLITSPLFNALGFNSSSLDPDSFGILNPLGPVCQHIWKAVFFAEASRSTYPKILEYNLMLPMTVVINTSHENKIIPNQTNAFPTFSSVSILKKGSSSYSFIGSVQKNVGA